MKQAAFIGRLRELEGEESGAQETGNNLLREL
jgi:hypothetical protein